MSRVENLSEAAGLELARGVQMKPLFGDGAMLNLLQFDESAAVGAHSHPHEQLGFVLEGELALVIDGVGHHLRPGDAYQIPGDVEHAARAVHGPCRVLDVFQPVREDYRERFVDR